MRPLTEREKKILQFEQLESELEEEPKLYKKDFEELLIKYHDSLLDEEASKSTIRQYMGNAKRFVKDYTSDHKYLTKTDVLDFKEDLLNEGYRPKTISNKITTVNRFLYYCQQGRKAVKNIIIQEENVIEDRLKYPEVKRMYTYAKSINDMDIYWLIKIMSRLGIRFEELKFVTAKSIQGTNLTISNKGTTKTIPIPETLRYELREYVEENKISGRIVDLTNQYANERLKFVAGRCKIKKSKVTTHAFRHYFAFRFLEVNPNGLERLKNILGHKSIETTAGYLKATASDYEDDMNRM